MISLIGNCQLHRFQFVLETQGVADFAFLANSDKLGTEYEPYKVLDAVRASDVVVAQPVFNQSHPLFYQTLLDANANTLFVPYIFIDGLFSLSGSGPLGEYVYGQEIAQALLRDQGLFPVLHRMRQGEIDFANRQRFDGSLAELKRREGELCHVAISDVIEAEYRSRRLMVTHNHPSAYLFDILSARIFRLLGRPYAAMAAQNHAARVVYAFGTTPRLFSPYDAEALGLGYDHDETWFSDGWTLLSKLAE